MSSSEAVNPVNPDADDAVWAAFNTNMGVEQLIRFCQEDVERLFRINPYIEYDCFEQTGDKQFHMAGKNSSQTESFQFDVRFDVIELGNGVKVQYQDGLKQSTTFLVEAAESGAKLTISDEYRKLDEIEKQARLGEVDQSIVNWANDLQTFIYNWKRWGGIPPYRWYMQKVWKKLKPTGRRIAYMLIWITVFEFALIALGVGIYFAEYA
ncbi:MAG: hypothetical protein OEY07_06735 [Gammaproteobacteria bacterium]|nr:hypothetical protein [Gammaproteobacteria bacterium]